jgi:hypothetical protein
MLRAFFMITALLFSNIDRGSALDMSVRTNDEERLVYLHLWGPIVSGDDQKFKNLVLLYVKKGYLIFEVSVFSSGGDVRAAMDIGNQVRMLQARTKSPMRFINEPEYAQCWFVASASHGGVGYHPNSNYKRDLSTNDGDSWCDCASACFLIWSSGMTREGNLCRHTSF